MNDRIARWHEEHANFARLLDLLGKQLELFHEGGRPRYNLMLDTLYYLTHYADDVHHPREELAFAKAAWRDPTILPVVEALTREHLALREKGDGLVEQLEWVLNEALLPRQEIERAGHDYIATLRRHMKREETDVFPVVARTLGAGCWEEIDRAIAEGHDPLFGPQVEARFRSLCRHIASEMHALS